MLSRQVMISRYGGPEVLQVIETDVMEPGPGQVLIRTYFAGVNFSDVVARVGMYQAAPSPPVVAGYEVAGVIEEIGPDVTDFQPGDKVYALTNFGGYSSHVAVPIGQVRPLPKNLLLDDAAGLPVTYLTAYLGLMDLGHLRAGQTVLIHNAGGGVGTAAVQVAKTVGCRVLGTASKGKHERLRDLGVDLCIDYRHEDFVAKVLEATNRHGVDLILDSLGPSNYKRDYQLLAPLGRLIMIGIQQRIGRTSSYLSYLRLAYEVLTVRFSPVNMMQTSRTVAGLYLGNLWNRPQPVKEALDQLTVWIEEGKIKPIIDKTFPYHQAPQAHAYIQGRHNFGKVLLDFRNIG